MTDDLRAIQIETLEHALRLAEERTAFWQGQYRKLNEWCTRTATKQIGDAPMGWEHKGGGLAE